MTGPLLLTFYGDDFTGSTDVMEALSSNGAPTVLFTRAPSDADRAAFPEAQAIGVAGESRSRPPDWMDANLPPVFEALKALGGRYCHYKTCSTFDSAPHTGSIGRATEIGMRVFAQGFVPIVVGAPQLRRYTMFGHLFAGFRDEVWRIDRHPVMSRHPSTPMAEADLRLHLAEQCALKIGLVGPDATGAEALDKRRAAGNEAAIVDVYDLASQARAGGMLEAARPGAGPFVVGSSGVEYALIAAWREAGLIGDGAPTAPLARRERIAVVSGSCSPTTERQIRAAGASGFAPVPLDFAAVAGGEGAEAAVDAALAAARGALREGRSPLIHTALGPDSMVAGAGGGDRVGRALGAALRRLKDEFALDRVVVAGGDTSSHALSALDVMALTLRRPLPESPGSPVCDAHPDGGGETFEIALKGGQVGKDDYFIRLRDGD